MWRKRYSEQGLWLFDRQSGTSILLDEIPCTALSLAPAFVSIAVTNACNWHCPHCFVQKGSSQLDFDLLKHWLAEMDENGTLGVGFGGGEPLLYRQFFEVCRFVHENTGMACTMTTNGSMLTDRALDKISSCVDFLRLSTNGRVVDISQCRRIASRMKFGINYLLTNETASRFEAEVRKAEAAGASEILVLPVIDSQGSIDGLKNAHAILKGIAQIKFASARITLSGVAGRLIPDVSEVPGDRGLRAYAHITANCVLKRDSFSKAGVKICESGLIPALRELEAME